MSQCFGNSFSPCFLKNKTKINSNEAHNTYLWVYSICKALLFENANSV